MKTPEAKPRFQSSNRHYHRYRGENREWNDWIDPAAKPASRKRWLWIAASVLLTGASASLLFYFGVL